MNVWVVTKDIPGETGQPVAVFGNELAAQRFADSIGNDPPEVREGGCWKFVLNEEKEDLRDGQE